MNKKTILTIVIIVVIAVVGIILLKNMPKQNIIGIIVPGETALPEGVTLTPAETPVAPVEGSKQAAPNQLESLTKEETPTEIVKLIVSASGFTPDEFSVKARQVITLSVTAGDEKTHIFQFNDASLSAVAVGIAEYETREITFKVPAKGDYSFFCGVPGHLQRGEKGVMYVK
ncbi:MAG: cupredoxin domain-containing protein [Patescibacteria group bacterium]|jgi:plastocyanin